MDDMLLPQQKDAIHKAWLYRLLSGIFDDALLAKHLYFKGGTCAAMLGYLDRFSVDLDFDFGGDEKDISQIRGLLENVFADLGLTVHDQSRLGLQYFLKYDAKDGERNTIKIDTNFPPPQTNRYEPKRFTTIDRIITCQTLETMVANKLVALMDRYQHSEAIAGRDIYDIHHFFLKGYSYSPEIIRERTKKEPKKFFADLIRFIEEHITDTIISQDLNVLLSYEKFRRIRKTLKLETLAALRDELKRLS